MRTPGWLVWQGGRREGDHYVGTFRLSRFYWAHPGFWVYVVTHRRFQP